MSEIFYNNLIKKVKAASPNMFLADNQWEYKALSALGSLLGHRSVLSKAITKEEAAQKLLETGLVSSKEEGMSEADKILQEGFGNILFKKFTDGKGNEIYKSHSIDYYFLPSERKKVRN